MFQIFQSSSSTGAVTGALFSFLARYLALASLTASPTFRFANFTLAGSVLLSDLFPISLTVCFLSISVCLSPRDSCFSSGWSDWCLLSLSLGRLFDRFLDFSRDLDLRLYRSPGDRDRDLWCLSCLSGVEDLRDLSGDLRDLFGDWRYLPDLSGDRRCLSEDLGLLLCRDLSDDLSLNLPPEDEADRSLSSRLSLRLSWILRSPFLWL